MAEVAAILLVLVMACTPAAALIASMKRQWCLWCGGQLRWWQYSFHGSCDRARPHG